MAKNAELKTAIENLAVDADLAKAPLEAILKTDPSDPAAFRAAIIQHEAFWKSQAGLGDAQFINSDDFLNSASPAPHTFHYLFQSALEKRAVMAVQTLPPLDLGNLIACNSYLDSRTLLYNNPEFKKAMSLDQANPWPPYLYNNFPDQFSDTVLHTIMSQAVIKDLSQKSKDFFISNYRNYGPAGFNTCIALLNSDDATFPVNLPAPYHGSRLLKADVGTAKILLGEQLLNNVIQHNDNLDDLRVIAGSASLEALQGTDVWQPLAPEARQQIINRHNEASFRQLAAERLLLKLLSSCHDEVALDAIAGASDGASVATILANHPLLGLAGTGSNENIRNVLSSFSNPGSVKTMAQVRKGLLNARSADLREFVAGPALAGAGAGVVVPGLVNIAGFATQYLDKFPTPGLSHPDMVAYFNQPENLFDFRQQALLSVVKEAFTRISGEHLADYLERAETVGLTPLIENILGDASGNDLVAGAYLQKFNNLVSANALAQLHMRLADGADLMTFINDMSLPAYHNLPLTEKTQIRSLLVPALFERFQIPDPAASTQLMAVVNAHDETQLKAALTAIGLTAQDWVNAETMKSVQKAAVTRAIAHQMGTSVHNRPELLKRLNDLPLAEQRKLLANNDFIPAIMKADSSGELRSILNVEPAQITDELKNEFLRIAYSSKIANAELAKHLAVRHLNPGKIRDINAILTAKAPATVADFSTAGYCTTIRRIADILEPAERGAFNQACGLNRAGDAIRKDSVRALMEQQHNYNALILARDAVGLGYTEGHYAFQRYLLSLSKGREFKPEKLSPRDSSTDHDLLPELTNSVSYNKFLDSNIVKGLDPVLRQSLRNTLTPAKYQELKQPFVKANFLERGLVDAALRESKKRLDTGQERITALKTIDKDIRDELLALSQVSSLEWLSPEFQATASRDAQLLLHRFKDLPEACDEIVKQFDFRIEQINQQLEALPEAPPAPAPAHLSVEQRAAIEDHRKELKDALATMLNGEDLYKRVQTLFRGDPLALADTFANKGLLAVLNEAVDGKKDIACFVGYKSSRIEYNLADKQKLLDGSLARTRISGGTVVDVDLDEADKGLYVVGNKIAPDKFYEYTIGDGEETKGCFMEERGVSDLSAKTKDGYLEVMPRATYTVSKFPQNPPLRAAAEAKAVAKAGNEARVEFAMAMACQILRDRPLNCQRPITLRQGDVEQMTYIWTALMILGKENPKLNINEKTIRIDSMKFNPKTETGTMGGRGFSRSSVYFTVFKKHPNLERLTGSFKNVVQEKFSEHKDERVSLLKSAQTIGTFKKELKQGNLLKDIKKDNEEEYTPPSLKP